MAAPQRLKPFQGLGSDGTTKVVPFPILLETAFFRNLSGRALILSIENFSVTN
jgi:hypothetical protein